MRTKTLLLSAAALAAGVLASDAQTVFSANAVGYVNLSLPAGFSMIANPLNGTNNNLSTILPSVPDNTIVYKFNPATQAFEDANTFFVDPDTQAGVWFPDNTLNPGEGAFISLPSAATLTFIGEVPQGDLVNTIPQNFSIRASQVPQSGGLSSDLAFPASNNDTVYQWDRQNQRYADALTFFVDPDTQQGVWFPSEPQPGVGEAFFIQNNSGSARDWTRTFSVNN